jgi:hypothetical protein
MCNSTGRFSTPEWKFYLAVGLSSFSDPFILTELLFRTVIFYAV